MDIGLFAVNRSIYLHRGTVSLTYTSLPSRFVYGFYYFYDHFSLTQIFVQCLFSCNIFITYNFIGTTSCIHVYKISLIKQINVGAKCVLLL